MSQTKHTTAVRAGIETDTQYGAVTPPLYLSSNYTFEAIGAPRKYDYSRSGNPNRDSLAEALSKLECGAGGVITSSGMSAVYLVTHLIKPGSLILAPHDCYGGTFRLLNSLKEKGCFDVEFVDQTNLELLKEYQSREPSLVWIETPSNPLLRVADIEAICEAFPNSLRAVDNTFLSPLLQNPLKLGADLVVHSTTKYINGHSDVIGGAVVAKTQENAELIQWWANCIGITASAFDSFITTRGLRTLGIRIKQHLANTEAVLNFLSECDAVKHIYYPGLKTHPTHDIAAKQQSEFGAMLSFEIDRSKVDLTRLIESLELFSLAESLGGVESLICHPATMTHIAMAEDARREAGIGDDLLRLSIGIEDAADLIADLEQALAASKK